MTEKTKATEKKASLKVKWDAASMKTSYANVSNATSTREEVSLFFGTNKTFNVPADGELTVDLDNRIVLNPFAAKRLNLLLSRVVAEYEKQYGEIQLGN